MNHKYRPTRFLKNAAWFVREWVQGQLRSTKLILWSEIWVETVIVTSHTPRFRRAWLCSCHRSKVKTTEIRNILAVTIYKWLEEDWLYGLWDKNEGSCSRWTTYISSCWHPLRRYSDGLDHQGRGFTFVSTFKAAQSGSWDLYLGNLEIWCQDWASLSTGIGWDGRFAQLLGCCTPGTSWTAWPSRPFTAPHTCATIRSLSTRQSLMSAMNYWVGFHIRLPAPSYRNTHDRFHVLQRLAYDLILLIDQPLLRKFRWLMSRIWNLSEDKTGRKVQTTWPAWYLINTLQVIQWCWRILSMQTWSRP